MDTFIKFIGGPAAFALIGYFMGYYFETRGEDINLYLWAAMGAGIWYAGLIIINGGHFLGELLEGIGDILD
jgi:hypothetical protein